MTGWGIEILMYCTLQDRYTTHAVCSTSDKTKMGESNSTSPFLLDGVCSAAGIVGQGHERQESLLLESLQLEGWKESSKASSRI